MKEVVLKPVGVVRSAIKNASLVAHSGDLSRADLDRLPSDPRQTAAQIIIDPDYAGILDGIEDFSHLLVLYWAHEVDPAARSLVRVHPMGRKDLPLVGIFSTCSPARPNPVLVIAVRLLERDGLTLRVQGLDAIDGSPVLDIKPYLPSYYSVADARFSAWMDQLMSEMAAHWGGVPSGQTSNMVPGA